MRPNAPTALGGICLLAVLLAAPQPVAAQNRPLNPSQELTLQPGDVLRISVWPDQDLSGEFAVEESGNVYLPFLGAVSVTGLSIEQLRVQLRSGYGEVLKEPVVTITPIFHVGVMGAVGRPGIYQMSPTEDLLDVIAKAGGFASEANPERIRIVRPGQVVELDVARSLEEGVNLADLRLRSGDRVIVPQKGGGFKAKTFFEVVRTITVTALLVDRLIERN